MANYAYGSDEMAPSPAQVRQAEMWMPTIQKRQSVGMSPRALKQRIDQAKIDKRKQLEMVMQMRMGYVPDMGVAAPAEGVYRLADLRQMGGIFKDFQPMGGDGKPYGMDLRELSPYEIELFQYFADNDEPSY